MSQGDQKSNKYTGRTFKIGTRKSQLALVQTHEVKNILQSKYENVTLDIIDMSTKGDEVLDRALFKIGDKSLFTKELENALINKDVDMVVHSLKDLPSTLPKGLVIGAVLERVDPSDVIVLKANGKFQSWEDLVQVDGSVIGTSSVRRTAQLLAKYPNLAFHDIRGNLNTRLKKLDDPDGNYDAIILAAAGIMRLNWQHRIHKALEPNECLHAVGQGALAVECRSDDAEILEMLMPLNDKATVQAVIAERAFMKFLDGGCSAPLAAHAMVRDGKISMQGGVWSLNGTENVLESVNDKSLSVQDQVETQCQELAAIRTPKEDRNQYVIAHQTGIELAQSLVQHGAKTVLETAKAQVHQSRNE